MWPRIRNPEPESHQTASNPELPTLHPDFPTPNHEPHTPRTFNSEPRPPCHEPRPRTPPTHLTRTTTAQATFTGSTMICCGCLSTVASLRRRTTSSSVITWTAESRCAPDPPRRAPAPACARPSLFPPGRTVGLGLCLAARDSPAVQEHQRVPPSRTHALGHSITPIFSELFN